MEIGTEVNVNHQSLETLNKGYNFLNIDSDKGKPSKKFFIEVLLDISQDLKGTEEELLVRTNLESLYCYYGRANIIDFLEELKKVFQKPFFKIKKPNNRKNMINKYDREIRNLNGKVRDFKVSFSDIEFRIGDLAKKKLKEMKNLAIFKNFDFVKEVKKILDIQQDLDKKRQKLIDRFIYLKEKLLTLETFKEKKGWYDSDKKNKTLKILITPQEYNQKLKEIETEMTKIAKEFDFEIDELDYFIIEQKVSFEKWFEVKKTDLEDMWETYEENENDETFDEYAQRIYDEMGGIIEIQHDKDFY